jgi:endonuclease-3
VSASRRSVEQVVARLARTYEHDRFETRNGPDPFRILIGCVLSLRTKDETSYPATDRLFARADDPRAMRRLRARTIAALIYPVGFYRRKSEQIREICRLLIERWDERVPDTIEDLLTLPGVGRKTANLVVTLGYHKPGICVDTHVHRISNRLGWIRTKHPHETEDELRALLPRRRWIGINEILVRHGQQVCKPISPMCSTCPVEPSCSRVGVTRSR